MPLHHTATLNREERGRASERARAKSNESPPPSRGAPTHSMIFRYGFQLKFQNLHFPTKLTCLQVLNMLMQPLCMQENRKAYNEVRVRLLSIVGLLISGRELEPLFLCALMRTHAKFPQINARTRRLPRRLYSRDIISRPGSKVKPGKEGAALNHCRAYLMKLCDMVMRLL